MSDVIISPNMNLPVPIVGQDPGPDWATNNNACLSAIDSHDHSTGKGVPITPAGIDITDNLPMNGFNLTTVNAVVFQQVNAALTALLRSIQVVDKDLYFVDGDGNAVRITLGGSVTGASGTITGLPSGTASASYAAGVFTWESATNTPAIMKTGPLFFGAQVANAKRVNMYANSAMAADYDITWPVDPPSANVVPVVDGSGNITWTRGLMPVGSVIATFPNLTGAYSTVATTAADDNGFVKCNGQTIADATSPMNGQVVPNINNSVFLMGSTTAGTTGGSATANGVGAHTHTFTSSTSVAASGHTHNYSHVHQWMHINTSYTQITGLDTQASSTTSIGDSDSIFVQPTLNNVSGGTERSWYTATGSIPRNWYTTGVSSGVNGTGSSASTGSPSSTTAVSGTTDSAGSSFSIVPPYISAVYLMRIK